MSEVPIKNIFFKIYRYIFPFQSEFRNAKCTSVPIKHIKSSFYRYSTAKNGGIVLVYIKILRKVPIKTTFNKIYMYPTLISRKMYIIDNPGFPLIHPE